MILQALWVLVTLITINLIVLRNIESKHLLNPKNL